jgi:hypothetical protein
MEALKRKPASLAALLLSLFWIAVVIWEIEIRSHSQDQFLGAPGLFFRVYEILQYSLVGVLTFLALAFLFERIWRDRPAPPKARVSGSDPGGV